MAKIKEPPSGGRADKYLFCKKYSSSIDFLSICAIFVCMNNPELLGMWLLKHPKVQATALPDCVCFERLVKIVGLGAPVLGADFKVCQYSSLASVDGYNHVPYKGGAYLLPVNLWRGDTVGARSIWEMFIADGWQVVDAATPDGCKAASLYFSACAYREALTTHSVGDFTGAFPDPALRSDTAGEFYLVSKYPNGIQSYNPVTRMPRRPKSRRSSRTKFTVNVPANIASVVQNQTVSNYIDNDNYALGA
jgi:hypothetical protein